MTAMCANSDPRLLAGMHDLKILPVATIVDSPDTVGLADSNLMRLDSLDEIDQELDMMQSIGVQNIRIGLYWAEIQPLPNVFNWTKADYIVDQANKRGMGVLASLNETPAWAGTPIGAGTPTTTDFAAYATTVAERYKGHISAFEIWNEPNAKFFLNPVSPANYTDLLKAGYTAIKAVDPTVTVIGGVLGSGRTTGDPGAPTTVDPYEFLQGMYAAGARGYFDALSFHPYKYDVKFSEQGSILDSPLRQLQELRALMDSEGDTAVKIWASEYGLPTNSGPSGVSEDQQAAFIEDFLNSWGQQPGTGPMFIYTARDINTGDTTQGDNFGIWRTDWTAKPAVQVIHDFIAAQVGPPSGNPIIDAIKNFIVDGAKLVGAVINGTVDVVVGTVKAIAIAVVSVVAGIAKVVVDVTEGIGNAITGVVNAVVNGIEHVFGVSGAASPAAPVAVSGSRVHRSVVAAAADAPAPPLAKKKIRGNRPARAAIASGMAATDNGNGSLRAVKQDRHPASGRDHRTGHGKATKSSAHPRHSA